MKKAKKIQPGYNAQGQEILDPRPVAVPVGYQTQQESIAQMIARLVRNQRHQDALANAGFETFEESNDFDCDDDFDPKTPYEEHYETIQMAEALEREAQYERSLREVRKQRSKRSKEETPTHTPNPKPELPATPPKGQAGDSGE